MMWPFVFVAMLLADVLWTEWSKAIAAKRAVMSGWYAAGIVVCGAFSTTEYVHDPILILPAAAGAALGTWWSVRRD